MHNRSFPLVAAHSWLDNRYAKGDGVAKDMEKANHFGERARELYVQDGVTVPPPQPTAAAGAASARGGDG